MTNLHTTGPSGPGIMAQNSASEDTKYIKRIDDLIEEAEIEAELEAEKKIRAKNTKLLTISILSAAMLLFLYVRMNGEEEIIAQAPEQEVPVTEIRVPLAGDAEELNNPLAEKAAEATQETAPAEPQEPFAPVAEAPAEPAQVKEKTPAAPQARPEPVKTKIGSAPVRKVEKVKIQRASTRGAKIPRPSATPSTPARQYFVQTGVFSIKGNAEKLSSKLKAAGFNPSISVKSRTLTRHVVKVGQFADEAAGESLKKELTERGFEAVLSRNAAGNFSFLTGSFKSSGQAAAFQDKLSLKGFLSTREKKTVTLPLYTVELGAYASANEAKGTQEKLARAGFNNHFVR